MSAVSRLSRCSRGRLDERPGSVLVSQLRAGSFFFLFVCWFMGETGMDPLFSGLFLTVQEFESRPDS